MRPSPPVRGFFTYPWDLLDEPILGTLSQMRDVYLSNAIAVCASYHTATLLTPRGTRSYVRERHAAAVVFRPDLAHYAPEGPWPLVDEATAEANVLEKVRDACGALGIQLNVWLVVLHSSALGRAHPDLTVRNVIGDAYSFSLCPSQRRVRAYAVGLVRDVCQLAQPHTLLLESASFVPALHGGHHDIVLLDLNPMLQWLLTLCFCPACTQRAAAAGVDVAGAAEDTRRLLPVLMNDEVTGPPANVRMDDMGSLLLELPRLAAYSQVRVATVMSLLAEMRAAASVTRTRIEVIPNTGVKPLTRSWALGISVSGLSDVADGAMVLGYYPDPADVDVELRQYRLLAGNLPFSVALNVGHQLTPTRDGLVVRAVSSARAGARGLFYYNWALLSEERLNWVRATNQAMLGG